MLWPRFGSHLYVEQIERLDLMSRVTGIQQALFWYDRDKAGKEGQISALEVLQNDDRIQATTFDWHVQFHSTHRGWVSLPANITDVCEFSVDQLQWLRSRKII